MIIKTVALGNNTEAFVEKNFTAGINIISSDDNNRGKTILVQSMMYALGNEPTFPTTFEYENYYHYIEFEIGSNTYHLCRHNGGFVLHTGKSLMLFDNVSELKRFWSKNIFDLPIIIKNEFPKIVDPALFLQLFFVGQDKKDTSNIANHGLYNKTDFYEMLFSYMKMSGNTLDNEEVDILKKKLRKLKEERSIILQQHKILKSQKGGVSYLSTTNDRILFDQKINTVEKINSKIADLRKSRNSTLNRRSKWQNTIKELNSLNRTIDCGELKCMDCDSTNISFSSDKKSTYTFDVSTSSMRAEIIHSINEKIASFTEEIERLSLQISIEQEKLNEILKDDDISLEAIIAYKKDVFTAKDAEVRIQEIDAEISTINSKLHLNNDKCKSNKAHQEKLLEEILIKMQSYYRQVDQTGNLVFDDLFTKKDEIYSGSESTVFHLVKMLSLQETIKHDFPIVVDSFRAEDLSTAKENVILRLFSKLKNQIIFTTTLKKEEFGKYKNRNGINNIDYQNNQPSKMLQANYVNEFKSLLTNVSLEF